MDLDIIQSTKEGEITQFLCDVRDYFKASLATSEYENTSNVFYLTASETTEKLLSRCESLLNRPKNTNAVQPTKNIVNQFDPSASEPNKQTNNLPWHDLSGSSIVGENNLYSNSTQHIEREINKDDVSYLDMSAANLDGDKKLGKMTDLNTSGDSDKTFRCSTLVVKQNKSFLHRLHDTMTTAFDSKAVGEETNWANHEDKYEEDTQIYDICQVATQGSDGEEDELVLEEVQKSITQDSHISLPNIDCPYMDLPAGHLSIKKSVKYGQLLKIEKRLFFDQSKKCYCGILNDWLLCYADGPTSCRPTISLYLKIPGIEIEHFGEGKRRDICFQISTCDPNKRFIFQSINEIDAKEWIHAIEAAIRSETIGADFRNSSNRKLPTPPVMKKITFLSSFQGRSQTMSNTTSTSNDCIYEEPSPIQQIVTSSISEKRPELPNKQNKLLDLKFEYDVPKCPPQPLKDNVENEALLTNPYENNGTNLSEKAHTITLSDSLYLASSPPAAQKLNLKIEENLDFQAKVKDVHSKLNSQLSNGPNVKKSLKKALPTTSPSETETLSLPSPTSPLPETADLKKQKKTSLSSNSPQKMTNAKNWFLNRLNKTTSSTRSNSSSPSNSPSKCKQSEKENLLNSSSDVCEGYAVHTSNLSNDTISPILKSSYPNSGTSKVNMIINQLEASGHLVSKFNADAVASFSSLCENDINNYEPIMTVSTPHNVVKKV